MHYKKVREVVDLIPKQEPEVAITGNRTYHRHNPYERKDVRCLRCNKTFTGTTYNRICENCGRVNDGHNKKSYRVVLGE